MHFEYFYNLAMSISPSICFEYVNKLEESKITTNLNQGGAPVHRPTPSCQWNRYNIKLPIKLPWRDSSRQSKGRSAMLLHAVTPRSINRESLRGNSWRLSAERAQSNRGLRVARHTHTRRRAQIVRLVAHPPGRNRTSAEAVAETILRELRQNMGGHPRDESMFAATTHPLVQGIQHTTPGEYRGVPRETGVNGAPDISAILYETGGHCEGPAHEKVLPFTTLLLKKS